MVENDKKKHSIGQLVATTKKFLTRKSSTNLTPNSPKTYEDSLKTNIEVSNNKLENVNTGGGAVTLGNSNIHNLTLNLPKPNPDNITKLVEKFRDISHESLEFQELVEYLDDYNRPKLGREIIGLENKLIKPILANIYL